MKIAMSSFTYRAQLVISKRRLLVDSLVVLRFLSMAVPAIILSPPMPFREVSAAFQWLDPSVFSLGPHIPSPEAVQSGKEGNIR